MSFEAEWARCGPWLAAALEHAGGTHGLSDVRALVCAGEAQFWPASASAAVSLVEEDPCERRLLLWLAGGELSELRDRQLPRLERWAKAVGCQRLLIIGRTGWERALQPHGYAPVARLIAKDLT